MRTDLENIQLLLERFKRPIPENDEYKNRLAEEFELILNQRFTDYFLRICDVIDLTKDLKHMTRGSAGSSLVCYLLGITDVDPIEWNIPVARFMNPLRDDLPDVDIDFEHWRQGDVMERIFKKWPGKTARLSNYVMFREKSAKKEAAKRLGAKGNLPRNFKYEDLGIDPVEAKRIEKKLIGKKRAISKHCGGIIMFDRQLPKSLISQDNQILLDKYEIEDLEHLKLDVLANRGLSQLLEIDELTDLIQTLDVPKKQVFIEVLVIETDVHPGFMTDWQQPLVVALTQAQGLSIVHETVYEQRFGFTDALKQMGANIQIYRECLGGHPCRFGQRNFNHSAVVSGPTKLLGADIRVPDLRGGFSHVVAALAAEGESNVSNVQLISRGYERFLQKLEDLGADFTFEA